MIRLTRLDGSVYVLNSDLIITVEATPDTVISTTGAVKYICKESVDEVIAEIIEFKGKIQAFANSNR
jgi:flagellar protein FlbD